MNRKKRIALLGSTGSIGTQTLDIIEEYNDLFEAKVLAAKSNWKLLASQAHKFKPSHIVIADASLENILKEAVRDLDVTVMSGPSAIEEIVCHDNIDLVVAAMVGYSGMLPTIRAIENGKDIALANKETLVAGGSIIMPLAKKNGVKILPVDSEHSAIFQCLAGEEKKSVKKLILTASGGPFRTLNKDEMNNVSVKDALAHPNWDMGVKVTIDSASMMNKGFEMIEARWLFNCMPENIDVVVHPQSIVHSMVEFVDGSIKAQLGIHDMHLPIRYALGYPKRLATDKGFLNISQFSTLTFEKPDFDKFPLLRLAYEAIEKGGNIPCIMNAANEVAVKAFVEDKIKFTQMPELIEKVMINSVYISNPTLEDIIATNNEAAAMAKEYLNSGL